MQASVKDNIPTSITIFGITGDLAKKKLIPALWNLFITNNLPDKFFVIGFARKDWSTKQLQDYVKDILQLKYENLKEDTRLISFIERFSYVSGDFNLESSYKSLKQALRDNDLRFGSPGAKIFHLSVTPNYYETIFENLQASGLNDNLTKLLIEKPFGSDWDSANVLDKKLKQLFKEEQIFRVDHYLAKESIQNIITFRFYNSLFEHLWSNQFIEKVDIRLWENISIGSRGTFYESVGALRDIGQNHLLEILALLTMEKPDAFDTKSIREARANVLEKLKVMDKEDVTTYVKKGQYKEYTKEPAIAENSKVETYFKIESYIDNERWTGVPFYLEGGKKLSENLVEAEIFFKKKENVDFQNSITFIIQPDERIEICFCTKKPGLEMVLETRLLSFDYNNTNINSDHFPDAYEKVIYDCMLGDQTLFVSTEEVLASWKFITSIIENWGELPLFKYESGWRPYSNN